MNPTTDGRILWEHASSYTSDSDEEDEQWQNRLNEATTLNYNMMIRSLHLITTQARYLLTYDGLTMMDEFLSKFENAVLEQLWFDALKWALRATLAH